MHLDHLRRTAILLLCALSVPATATATTFHVDGLMGADGPTCGPEASPCATIQQAVDLSISGDTVLVAEGTYVDNVSCLSEAAVVCVFQKQVTILGGFTSGSWSLPDPVTNTTIIDGQNTRRGVLVRRGGADLFLPATSLRMEGFTVTRGRAVGAPNGVGGGLKANFSDVTLRDMVFDSNVAMGGNDGLGGGGGVAVQANADNVMNVTLERTVFRDNQATGGGGTGGVGIGGGLLVDYAAVTGLSLTFDSNTATGGASATAGRDSLGGGAAFSFGAQGTLRDVTATGNSATAGSASATGGHAFGGAIYLEGAESPVASTTNVTILDSYMAGNTSTGGNGSTGGGGVGGAVDAFASQTTIERCTLVGNSTAGGSGSSVQGNAGGGGVFLEWPFTSTAPLNVIRNTVVADNVIAGAQGGGAGIRLLGARALVAHSTLVDNRIVGAGFGLGILVGPRFATSKASELTLAYSILADHTVPNGVRTLHVQANASVGSTADLSDPSLFVGNSLDTNSGQANSGTYVGYPGSNVFDPSPSTFFVDPATSDYHVDGTTPPTDAAAGSTETVDLDGASRTGTRDMGADEVGAVAFDLTVGKVGVGTGTVVSSPAGIDCGADCFETYAENTSVTLIPTPDIGSFFTGWSGDTDCADGSVLIIQDLACTAQFEDQASVACSVGDTDLILINKTVNNTVTESACASITAGPSYTVGASGNVTFHSPTIILRNGFSVGGRFVAISGIP